MTTFREKFAIWRYARRVRRTERLIQKAFKIAPDGYVPDVVGITFNRAVQWCIETDMVAVIEPDGQPPSTTIH